MQSTPPRIPIDKVDGRGSCPEEGGNNMAGSQSLHHTSKQLEPGSFKLQRPQKNTSCPASTGTSASCCLCSLLAFPPCAIRSQLRTPAPFHPEAVTSSSPTTSRRLSWRMLNRRYRLSRHFPPLLSYPTSHPHPHTPKAPPARRSEISHSPATRNKSLSLH